jgi:hypothetical protein
MGDWYSHSPVVTKSSAELAPHPQSVGMSKRKLLYHATYVAVQA